MREHITLDNIADDDLWFLANHDVLVEREGHQSPSKHSVMLEEIFQVVISSLELELQYAGILECAFENHDVDKRNSQLQETHTMNTQPKLTLDAVNVSHGKPGQGEIALALVTSPVFGMVRIGCTYDAEYTPNSKAFWLRFSENTADVQTVLGNSGWRWSGKNRKAYVHTVNDEAILFLAELGIDAMAYASGKPVAAKSTETKSTLAPMQPSKDMDKALADKAKAKAKETPATSGHLAIGEKVAPTLPITSLADTAVLAELKGELDKAKGTPKEKIAKLKLALAEAEAEARAEVARKEAEARAKAERDAKAKEAKASETVVTASMRTVSLADWDNDKLHAKLEDALATLALIHAELRRRS